MSDCTCQENALSAEDHVPDFSVHGFDASANELSANLEGVQALQMSLCVSATYQNGQLCFKLPVFGTKCVSVPVKIPVGATLKVCGQTCGGIIPKGVKLTLYVNNVAVYTFNIGKC